MNPLRAPVHFNEANTLMVIPNLVQETFGIQKPKSSSRWIGTCFVAQVSFTISSITGLKPMEISKHILRNIDRSVSQNGATLEEIMRTFELPLLTRQGPVWLKLGVSVYNDVAAMADAILMGHPVITIIAREVGDVLESEAATYNDGCTFATAIRPASEGRYHSYLAIGYEVKPKGGHTDFVILRDSRHEYCHKGYLKLGVNVLHQGFNFIRALSIDVLAVER
jgi:hypothetical protein